MTLSGWIAHLQTCIEELKIPETRDLKDYERLLKLLLELRERRNDITLYKEGYRDGYRDACEDMRGAKIVEDRG